MMAMTHKDLCKKKLTVIMNISRKKTYILLEGGRKKIITGDFLFRPFSFVARLLDILVVEELVPHSF